MDHGRFFLLSLALLPACVDRSSKDDGGDGPNRKLGDGCKALYDNYLACYEEAYADTGAETGYGTDGYDTEGYDVDELCKYVTEYITEEYGAACARAQDDLMACLSKLDCDGLQTGDDTACATERDRGHEACPELFPSCECVEYGSSDGSCSLECDECVDANTYALSCMRTEDGAGITCACTNDGTQGESFPVDENACTDLRPLAQDRCGLPE